MTLTQIAAELRRTAQQTGAAKQTLPRGLALSLRHGDNGQRTLGAGRIGIYPSTDEAIIIARAFGVPIAADPTWRIIANDAGPWHIITWRWIERDLPTQSSLIPPATTYR